MTTKRVIVPYKGGRSTRVYLRVKPEVKEHAEKMAAKKGATVADLFENWVLADKYSIDTHTAKMHLISGWRNHFGPDEIRGFIEDINNLIATAQRDVKNK